MRWSLLAADDLENICSYIALDSEKYAKIVAQEIVSTVESISVFPYSGKVVPKFNPENIREKIIRNYRIIYRIHDEYVEVVRIIHQSRQLKIKLDG